MENKNKTRTLKIRGQEVEVSEEVYRAYIRPIRAEQRRKRREWKCRKLSETGGYYVCCKERCESCPYYLAGNSALGNVTSLDKRVDCEVEIEDRQSDVEANYIEQETIKEEYANLHAAIATLTPRQQEIVRLIYFEGKTQEEVRLHLGIAKSTMTEAVQRIHNALRKFLEKINNFHLDPELFKSRVLVKVKGIVKSLLQEDRTMKLIKEQFENFSHEQGYESGAELFDELGLNRSAYEHFRKEVPIGKEALRTQCWELESAEVMDFVSLTEIERDKYRVILEQF